MTTILGWFGLHPDAAGPAIADFLRSLWRSAVTLLSAFLALAYAQGALQTPQAFVAWVKTAWWAFVVASIVVPFIQGGKTAKSVTDTLHPNL